LIWDLLFCGFGRDIHNIHTYMYYIHTYIHRNMCGQYDFFSKLWFFQLGIIWKVSTWDLGPHGIHWQTWLEDIYWDLDLALFQPNPNTWWVLKHIYDNTHSLAKWGDFGERIGVMYVLWTCHLNLHQHAGQSEPASMTAPVGSSVHSQLFCLLTIFSQP